MEIGHRRGDEQQHRHGRHRARCNRSTIYDLSLRQCGLVRGMREGATGIAIAVGQFDRQLSMTDDGAPPPARLNSPRLEVTARNITTDQSNES